jgi:hypothetical protein
MFRGLAIALTFALAFAACTPGVDVVARAKEVNDLPDGAKAPGSAGKPEIEGVSKDPGDRCTATDRRLAVLTKHGELYRVDLGTASDPEGGVIACLPADASAVAIDHTGTPWIAAGGALFVVDGKTDQCKKLERELTPTAMTFVWDPKRARSTLYAVVDRNLLAIDPATLADTPVKSPPLDGIRAIASASAGRLLAFSGDTVLTVAELAPDTGTVLPKAEVKPPDPLAHFGGGAEIDGVTHLVFGSEAYSFVPPVLESERSLFSVDPGIVALSAPPCSPK